MDDAERRCTPMLCRRAQDVLRRYLPISPSWDDLRIVQQGPNRFPCGQMGSEYTRIRDRRAAIPSALSPRRYYNEKNYR